MVFNIDPRKLSLQDAAGMQLVGIIRNLADDVPNQYESALIRNQYYADFSTAETQRGPHDCTFIGDELVSFNKPSDGGYASYINPITWERSARKQLNFVEANGKELEMKSVDYKYNKLLVGNGRAIKDGETSYTDQGARIYVFYDADDWRDSDDATITFANCGDYDVIDLSTLGYKMYAFWGGADDTIFVSCNLFNDVYLIQLGKGEENLGSGTYTAASEGRYNGSYKTVGHWSQDNGLGNWAAHGGQYYNGSLYLATNDTSKCTVYRCVLEHEGALRFDEINFALYNPASPSNLAYRYIDGMCIHEGKLYAQPLVTPASNNSYTTMLIAAIDDVGDKYPEGGTDGQVLTRTSDGVGWTTPSGGGGGSDYETIATGTLSEEATAITINTDSDGNAFELKEAILYVKGVGTTTNTGNGDLTMRTNTNSAALGGAVTFSNFIRSVASQNKYVQAHFTCVGIISSTIPFDGATVPYQNNNYSTLTAIYLFGTADGKKTLGVGTEWTLLGKRV